MRSVTHFIPSKFLIWLCSCFIAAVMLDFYATRTITMPVEKFRHKGMTDEQVVSVALSEGMTRSQNWWWIRHRKIELAFDPQKHYKLESNLYKSLPVSYTKNNQDYIVPLPAYSSR